MNRKMIGEAIYIRVSDRISNPITTKRGNVPTQRWSDKSAVFLMHTALLHSARYNMLAKIRARKL
jgi:hypothetical protein